MFQNFKLGGYNLEGTQVDNQRLIALILLITLASSYSTFPGNSIKSKVVAKYVTRPSEPKRTYRRHSSFSIGLNGCNWLDSLAFFQEEMQQLTSVCLHKQPHYRRGLRAASLIHSAL